MKKLHLDGVNPGNYPQHRSICERLITFNNGFVDLSDTSISIKTKSNQAFKSNLRKTEQDDMSETYQGTFEDGTTFRLIRPGKTARNIFAIQGIAETLSFGGMSGDSYAVHFDLVPATHPDK